MEINSLVTQFLEERHAMQVATTSDKGLWCCTVYYVADDDRNLYWASLPSRRHSQEIAVNGSVAAAIVVKAVIGEKVIGIQVAGHAEMLEPQDAPRNMVEKYAAKFGRDAQWIEDFTTGKTEHRMYKLTPSTMVLFDEEHFPDDPRRELI